MLTRDHISRQIDEMIRAAALPGLVLPRYLGESMVAYPASGGKRLRPALLLWCCEAAGGNPETAWDAALAVELYHNWTLIHDDIIDADATRRGRATCHVALGKETDALPGGGAHRRQAFGENMAILAGDVLHGWSVDSLARSVDRGADPSAISVLIRRMCGWLTPKLISGEALDVEFELRETAPADEILQMMYLKTGALLQFCAEAGTLLGAGHADLAAKQVCHAGEFAAQAGVAFQIQDDILGVFAAEDQLGKPIGSDLCEGKHTLLLSRTLERLPHRQAAEFRGMIGTGALTDRELETCQAMIAESGAREALEREARDLSASAREHLSQAFADSSARIQLEEWLAFLTERTF